MITKTDKEVGITIEAEDLYRATAFLKDLREFCKLKAEEKAVEMLMVAIETMTAFWAEHFAEDEVE